jgi:twitching motility protein PilT
MRPPARDPATAATQQMSSQTVEMSTAPRSGAGASQLPASGQQRPPSAAQPAAPAATQAPRRGPGPSPGQPTLAEIVRKAFDNGISDIHVGVAEVPRFRKRGDMEVTDYPVTDDQTFTSWRV